MADVKTLGQFSIEIQNRKKIFSQKCAAELERIRGEVASIPSIVAGLPGPAPTGPVADLSQSITDLEKKFEQSLHELDASINKKFDELLVEYAEAFGLLGRVEKVAETPQAPDIMEILTSARRLLVRASVLSDDINRSAEESLKGYSDALSKIMDLVRRGNTNIL